MDVSYGSKANGWAGLDMLMEQMTFEVTSQYMTRAEITRALNVYGATVHVDHGRVIADIPADSAGNVLSQLFTCHFVPTEPSQAH